MNCPHLLDSMIYYLIDGVIYYVAGKTEQTVHAGIQEAGRGNHDERKAKSELLYLQEFHSMEHFKQELIEYLDYYNNRRIKAKRKGLPPAIHRQQALSVA